MCVLKKTMSWRSEGCVCNIPVLLGGFKHEWIIFISDMGCRPNPIDELHHSSRWLLHHQPEYVLYVCLTVN